MKADCLLLKKKEKKEKWKRVMAALTWSYDEESGSKNKVEPKEVANLCLMAHEDEDEVSNSNISPISFDELQDTFDELMIEFKKIEIKIVYLKNWSLPFQKIMKIYTMKIKN